MRPELVSTLVFVVALAMPPLSECQEVRLNESFLQHFEEQEAEVARSIREDFVSQLKALEKRAVVIRDFETAIKIRDKRLPIEALLRRYDPKALQRREAQAIELTPQAATRTGPVFFKDGALTSWSTPKCEASWTVKAPTPGDYAVEITYSASAIREETNNAETGGVLWFMENTELATDTIPLRFDILPKGDWSTYRTEIIGTMSLSAKSRTLKLRCIAVEDGGLMRMKLLRLIPLSVDDPADAAAPVPTYEASRASFESALARKSASLDRGYLNALRAMIPRATGEALERLQEEVAAMEALLGTSAK